MVSNPELIEDLRWQLKLIEDRKAENRRALAGMVAGGPPVTVLTGPGGAVSEVRLAPEAMRLDAVTLGRAITAAIQDAAGALPPSPPAHRQRQPQPQPQRRSVPAAEEEPYDTVYDV